MIQASNNNQNHIIGQQPLFIEKLPRGSADLDFAADLLAEAFLFGNKDPKDPTGKGLPDPFYNRLNQGVQKVHNLFRSIIHLASEISLELSSNPQSKT